MMDTLALTQRSGKTLDRVTGVEILQLILPRMEYPNNTPKVHNYNLCTSYKYYKLLLL